MKLNVWTKSHELTLKVYRLSERFPKSEAYGLTSQIRRAASSIPINIGEGSGSIHKKEFLRYLSIARSSANELEYELFLCRDLKYIHEETFQEISREIKQIQKMLNGLIKSLKDLKE